MKEEILINKLEEFKAKAGCIYTQRKSKKLWSEIKEYLNEKDYYKIVTAWGHHVECGEGRGELDNVINKIIKNREFSN